MSIKIGDKIPNIQLLDDSGKHINLHDYLGSKIVLYFYPKDNTPGCTKESCGFRDLTPDFRKVNAKIFGVSKDSVAKHQKFKSKYNFPFTLIADTEAELCQAFGVIVDKSMFGKKYKGIDRSTFLIDEQGIVQAIWRNVKVSGHVDEVLAKASELSV